MNFGQAVGNVFAGIGQAALQQLAQMAAEWIIQHTLMAAVSSAFKTEEVAEHVGAEAIKTGATATGEAARTGVTATGSLTRRGIHVAETIFHNLHVAFRTAAHIASEIAKTAVTIAQAAIRLPVIIMESMAHVIKGAVQAFSALASIPYVGPFLGAAAMAAALAGGIALVSKIGHFADGGYHAGEGGPRSDRKPVMVSNGEYTLNAATVSSIGKDRLDAWNFGGEMPEAFTRTKIVGGGSGGGGGASGAAQPQPVMLTPRFIVVDSDREADRIADNEENEAFFIKMARKHRIM
jgi:hypothetical protein